MVNLKMKFHCGTNPAFVTLPGFQMHCDPRLESGKVDEQKCN